MLNFNGYKVNQKHRVQNPSKICTQWTVDEWEEVKLFTHAKSKGWNCNKGFLWAVKKEPNGLAQLGKTNDDIAYIAKYVADRNHEWHGYPVSTARNGDRPPTIVLDAWRVDSLISKATQAKIVKGRLK